MPRYKISLSSGFFGYMSIFDCFAFAMLIFGLASQKGPVDPLLRTRAVLCLGKISFFFYLLHEVLLSIFKWPLLPGVMDCAMPARVFSLIGLIMICFMAAWAMFHLVERPSQRLGRSVIKRLKTASVTPEIPVSRLTAS
jgi:peptidoglycan/LPS O-acetylase OafA/YrhL